MTATTLSRSPSKSFDQQLADDRAQARIAVNQLVRDVAFGNRDFGNDRDRIKQMIRDADWTLEDFREAVSKTKARLAKFKLLAAIDPLSVELAEAETAVRALESERAALVEPLDAKITEAQSAVRGIASQIGRLDDVRRKLLEETPEHVREALARNQYDTMIVSQEIDNAPIPARHEARWEDRQGGGQWQPLNPDRAESRENFERFVAREREHKDRVKTELQPRLARLRDQKRRLQELACQPAPTEADLATLLAEFEAEETAAADALRREHAKLQSDDDGFDDVFGDSSDLEPSDDDLAEVESDR